VTDPHEAPVREIAVRLRAITGLTLEDRVDEDDE